MGPERSERKLRVVLEVDWHSIAAQHTGRAAGRLSARLMRSYPALMNPCHPVRVKMLVVTALASATAAFLAAAAHGGPPRLDAPVAGEIAYPGVVQSSRAPKGATRALA